MNEIEECLAINVLDSLVIDEFQKACDNNMVSASTKADFEEAIKEDGGIKVFTLSNLISLIYSN